MIEILVVSPETASLLDKVDDDVFDLPVQPAFVREYLAQPTHVLVVAVLDGEVVGMASGLWYIHPDKPRSLFINEVGVSSRVQGQGIGKKLIARIVQWGRERGCVEAWVATEVGNIPARKLYESTGGAPDEEHAVVYVYSLDEAPTNGAN